MKYDPSHAAAKECASVNLGRLLRSAYLLYFSQPASDRTLFRAIHRRPIRTIVEMGISLAGRTPRVLEIARWRQSDQPLRYTGIDLFEARPADQPQLTIKQANASLRQPEMQLQLVPGDPATALRRMANSLVGTDLLIISANQDRDSLAAAWTWMPRMLTADSLIFVEEPAAKPSETAKPAENQWRRLSLADVQALAAPSKRMRRAA
jgi:hypothetical protein